MNVPVQPERHAARRRRFHRRFVVAQDAHPLFERPRFGPQRVVRDDDANAVVESVAEPFQAVELVRADLAAGVEVEAVRRRAVDGDQPDVADLAGERVRVVVDPFADLPGAERRLELAGSRGLGRVVVVDRKSVV